MTAPNEDLLRQWVNNPFRNDDDPEYYDYLEVEDLEYDEQ